MQVNQDKLLLIKSISSFTFSLASSGPFATVAVDPCFLFCLYVFIIPQRYALLLDTCSNALSRNCFSTAMASSALNSFKASSARSSNSACVNFSAIRKTLHYS